MKALARAWLPPALVDAASRLRGGASRWSGNYRSWKEAEARSTGYGAPAILEKVKAAALKVQRGEAAYERDGVTFEQIEYSWPLLAGLMWIATQNGGRLDVLDFGGGLGTSYQQNRRFLADLAEVRWSVVEQPAFVACGKQLFESDRLRFYDSIESGLADRTPQTLVLSSVLQYLEDPYGFIETAGARFPFAIVDLTPAHGEASDRLTVQAVPASIYPARYPCWFFSEERLRTALLRHWEVVARFDSHLGSDLRAGRLRARYLGLILKKRATA